MVLGLTQPLTEMSTRNTGLFKMVIGVIHNTQLMQPHVILSMGLRQGLGLCSSSSRKYPGTEGTNQNRH